MKPLRHNPPRLLFFVSEDWYFFSHRLPLAIAAREAGYEVVLLTRVRDHGSVIEEAGIRVIPLEMSRHGINLIADIAIIWKIISVYRHERPDIVHHVAIKPVLYGSIAARLTRVPRVVNAVAGLGYLFVSKHIIARLLKWPVVMTLRMLLNRPDSRLILQNPDDAEFLRNRGIARDASIRLIRGSGVDLEIFAATPQPGNSPPVILLPARLLWDKGVDEFVEAAKRLKAAGIAARFVLAGDMDRGNPASVNEADLESWRTIGLVEYWGRRADMPAVFTGADIVCLPSYREGLPKALIEAASCARPIVATDVPGCREVVINGENGLLVPPRDARALAAALERLVRDDALRATMGARGRNLAEAQFGIKSIVYETMNIYRELLA